MGQKLAVTLADGSEFTCEEEVAATYGTIFYYTKQVSEWLILGLGF